MTPRDKRSRRTQRALQRQRQKRIRTAVAMVLALAMVLGAFFLLSGGDDDQTVLAVGLVEYGFEGDLVVPEGPVTLSATNIGAIPHNVGIRGGPISSDLRPGASRDLDLGELTAGTYELYCDVGDHEQRGMVATLVVTATADP